MKKIIGIALVLLMAFGFAACSGKKESKTTAAVPEQAADIVFKEANYVTLINDVYNNPDTYLGKTVQIDGMFTSEDFSQNGGKIYYYVYRQGPGCCGNDGSMCGFEFTTADGAYPDYTPQSGDDNAAHPWIKVTGTLEQYYEGEGENKTGPYYTLNNATYQVMNTRGAEVVSL